MGCSLDRVLPMLQRARSYYHVYVGTTDCLTFDQEIKTLFIDWMCLGHGYPQDQVGWPRLERQLAKGLYLEQHGFQKERNIGVTFLGKNGLSFHIEFL